MLFITRDSCRPPCSLSANKKDRVVEFCWDMQINLKDKTINEIPAEHFSYVPTEFSLVHSFQLRPNNLQYRRPTKLITSPKFNKKKGRKRKTKREEIWKNALQLSNCFELIQTSWAGKCYFSEVLGFNQASELFHHLPLQLPKSQCVHPKQPAFCQQ